MAQLKFLIVDDEIFMRSIVNEWIRAWGFEAVLAGSGPEAVAAIAREKFDIVILDYVMPEMDGLATLKVIRQMEPKIPVIMFTGHPTGESLVGTEELGISAYITKLNDAGNIQRALKSVISLIEKKHKK